MRSVGFLLSGWICGGLVIVAMSAAPRASTAAVRSAAPASRGEGTNLHSLRPAPQGEGARSADEGLYGSLQVPVLGVSPSELHDTFSQARGGGRLHRAIDILAPHGTPVVAVADGTIRKLFNSRAGGLTIYQFDVSETHNYYYAHLDRYANGLQEGAMVKQGTVIGYVGITGNAPPQTPHLHFAVELLTPTKEWWKGEAVNPYPLLTRSASALR